MGFVVCNPNEVLVITGSCHGDKKVVSDGVSFLWPGENVQRLILNSIQLNVETPQVTTKSGSVVNAISTAVIKVVPGNKELLCLAVEHFSGKSEDVISETAKPYLERHQVALIESMEIEELMKSGGKKFAKDMFDRVAMELLELGLSLVNYTVRSIRYVEGYPGPPPRRGK